MYIDSKTVSKQKYIHLYTITLYVIRIKIGTMALLNFYLPDGFQKWKVKSTLKFRDRNIVIILSFPSTNTKKLKIPFGRTQTCNNFPFFLCSLNFLTRKRTLDTSKMVFKSFTVKSNVSREKRGVLKIYYIFDMLIVR